MATILLFLLLSAILTAEAQQQQSIVSPDSSLTPTSTNSSWPSPSGLYAFGFYKQGNGYAVGIFLAGIPQKTSDGRLVLQSTQFTVPSLGITADGATSASMLDTGNFVVYNSDNKSIWESFQHPTDTLLPTQKLSASANDDAVLDSSVSDSNQSTGLFRALMQQDGFIALYPRGTPYRIEYGYWSKNVPGPLLGASLNLGVDGRLYLANGNNTNIISTAVNSTTGRVLYRLRMDSDGFLRLYSYNMAQLGRDWSITWSVKNDNIDRCEPKGLCGVNAFCVIYDEDYNCSCLPGFTYIDNSIRTYGCERISAIEGCREESIAYTMEAESNTIWENNTYSFPLFSSTEEECKNACLEDCNCEAAFFKDSACEKQRLPLRFGRRKPEDTNIALIKVRTSTPTTDGIVPKETKKEVRLDILIISVSLVAFAIIVLAISGIVIYKSCVFGYRNTSNNGNIVLSDDDFAPRSFTYAELEKMTDNFKEELGRGSFGIVYKGSIRNGQKFVAVKRLEKLLADREREFQTEMKVIGRTHHKNLICLLGYCHDGPNRLLVYEYMSNGSLADILFTPEKKLSWDERIEIACNIARGILYLHEECMSQIIHCDIKPQNILMDENRCAKISDFGLAKLMKLDQSKTLTGIRGTRGYVAPEWHRRVPHVTVKVDVYSFGIVLLEIICCRKSVDCNLPEKEAILEEWTYNCFEHGELSKLLNDEEVDNGQLERMVKVALWCILDDPSLRPSMKKVLLMLEGTMDIPIPPNPTSVLSVI
uniref:Receptor-like serine/threonine-protein kinase n=1 Tax=Fagus sylvatica TaxID=28930 RepID=A0A2N9I2W6_FAGSY